MDPLLFDDPCVLFAMHREARGFLREFRLQERFAEAPCRAVFAGPEWLTVLIVESGMGPDAAQAALEWLLGEPKHGNLPYRPKLILNAGFGGGLKEQHQVGDLVLATEVVDESGMRIPTTWPGPLPQGNWNPPLLRGRILSTKRVVGDPDEKTALGLQHDAEIVDMESAIVARMCSARDIPFGCLRAVSDPSTMRLSPQLVSLIGSGRVSMGRVLGGLLRSPSLVGELWRLAKHTQKASHQLGKALGELLTLTLSWAKDL